MKMTQQERWQLADGNSIPVLGYGLYRVESGSQCQESMSHALKNGYRHFDTAAIYQNEQDVGSALRKNAIAREEVFITTKLWNTDQGYNQAQKALDLSLEKLGMDYVDLYLIHWPVEDKRLDSWKALISLKKQGKAKSIGVSNYTVTHLCELIDNFEEKPVINQVEFSPFLYQKELLNFCQKNAIQLEAYAAITRGQKLNDPVITEIAGKYKKTAAQILLRWCLQHQVIPLVKSATPQRILENSLIFDFSLDEVDLIKLDALNQNLHISWDPTNAP